MLFGECLKCVVCRATLRVIVGCWLLVRGRLLSSVSCFLFLDVCSLFDVCALLVVACGLLLFVSR